MEGPEERLPMCFYHQNVISSPYNFKVMLLQEEAHQCNRTSLPWEHLPGEKATFVTHVSTALKDFVIDNLQLGFFVSQVMVKHCRNV